MTRYGTVLVFKDDASRKEIDRALQRIKDILDPSYCLDDKGNPTPYRIEEFDGSISGGPVWYIP